MSTDSTRVTRQQATITSHPDPWGDVRRIRVEWMPWDVSAEVNPGRPYERPVVLCDHEDDPPVRLVESKVTHRIRVEERMHQLAAEVPWAAEFGRAQDDDDLTPGSYRILSDAYPATDDDPDEG